jgi:predicted nucleotide-binding protein (sugar kinase/HSP70/actin superfamily)
MGCLPEISARPFLKKIGSEHKFPLLTLSLDEMTSESATRNRIEAFVDMVRARK